MEIQRINEGDTGEQAANKIYDNDTGLLEEVEDRIRYTEIVDNTTTTVSDRPLSAAQGALLADRIDSLIISIKSACPFSATLTELEDGSTQAKDERLSGWYVYSVEAGGFFLFSDRGDFEKDKDADVIMFPPGMLAAGSIISIQLDSWRV